MKKGLKAALKGAISLLLIGYLVHRLGPSELLKVISGFNPWYLIPVILIFGLNSCLGGLNIQLMLMAFENKLPYLTTLKHFLRSWAFGLFLPSKLGEFSLIVFLKKEGIEYSKGLLISLADKLITLFVLFCLSFVGLARLIGLANASLIVLGLLAFIALAGGVLLTPFGKSLIKRLAFKWLDELLTGFMKNLAFLMRQGKRYLFLNTLVTFAKWLLVVIMVQLLLLGLGIRADFPTIMIAVTLGILVSLIPISISGLGVTENVAVEAFVFYGVPGIAAGSAMLLLTVIRYIQALLIFWLL
jgi:glycosyltransferase 2 family protein